jgi:hypothetical protein
MQVEEHKLTYGTLDSGLGDGHPLIYFFNTPRDGLTVEPSLVHVSGNSFPIPHSSASVRWSLYIAKSGSTRGVNDPNCRGVSQQAKKKDRGHTCKTIKVYGTWNSIKKWISCGVRLKVGQSHFMGDEHG